MRITLVQALLLLLPPTVLVAIEASRRSPARSRRPYLRFLAVGFLHGVLIWALFLRSEWRPHHDLMTVLAAAPIGLLLGVAFAAAYLAIGYVLARFKT